MRSRPCRGGAAASTDAYPAESGGCVLFPFLRAFFALAL